MSLKILPPADAAAFVAAGVVQTGADGQGVYLSISRNGSWVIADKLSLLVGRSTPAIAHGQTSHPPGEGGYYALALELSTGARTTVTARVGEETVWMGTVKAINRGTVMIRNTRYYAKCDGWNS